MLQSRLKKILTQSVRRDIGDRLRNGDDIHDREPGIGARILEYIIKTDSTPDGILPSSIGTRIGNAPKIQNPSTLDQIKTFASVPHTSTEVQPPHSTQIHKKPSRNSIIANEVDNKSRNISDVPTNRHNGTIISPGVRIQNILNIKMSGNVTETVNGVNRKRPAGDIDNDGRQAHTPEDKIEDVNTQELRDSGRIYLVHTKPHSSTTVYLSCDCFFVSRI